MTPYMSAHPTTDGLIELTKDGQYVTRLLPAEACDLVDHLFRAITESSAPGIPGIQVTYLDHVEVPV